MPQWIKFKLVKRPFYDPRTGVILPDIEGRKNRPRIDPFEGGGKIYPEIHGKILDRYEIGGTLLVQMDDGSPWGVVDKKEEVVAYKAEKGNRIPARSEQVIHEFELVREEQVKELVDSLVPIDGQVTEGGGTK